jgi:hypothetical protein
MNTRFNCWLQGISRLFFHQTNMLSTHLRSRDNEKHTEYSATCHHDCLSRMMGRVT